MDLASPRITKIDVALRRMGREQHIYRRQGGRLDPEKLTISHVRWPQFPVPVDAVGLATLYSLVQAFGAYLAALVQDRGWSKTALSGAAALKSTEAALLGPVLGWLVDRFGSQRIVRAGGGRFAVFLDGQTASVRPPRRAGELTP